MVCELFISSSFVLTFLLSQQACSIPLILSMSTVPFPGSLVKFMSLAMPLVSLLSTPVVSCERVGRRFSFLFSFLSPALSHCRLFLFLGYTNLNETLTEADINTFIITGPSGFLTGYASSPLFLPSSYYYINFFCRAVNILKTGSFQDASRFLGAASITVAAGAVLALSVSDALALAQFTPEQVLTNYK